jgi:predicted MFS family arabinose efflux permease
MNRWAILALAWCGWVFDVADTAIFNFAKGPMLTQMLGVNGYAKDGPRIEAQIQSVFLLGWAIGGLIFGVLADRWGRTRTLVLTVLLYCVFTGATALCKTPEQVALARFVTALGIGGEWAAGAALIAEAFVGEGRSLASSVLQTAAAFGPMIAALGNWALAGKPWQWLFLLGVLPAMLCVGLRWSAHDPKPISKDPQFPLSEIFASPIWRRRVIAAMVIGAVGIMGAGTATFWAPNLVKAASVGLSKAAVDARTSEVTILSHVGTLAGVFLAPYLCRRVGRRATIGAFYVASPVAVAVAIGRGADYSRLLWSLPLVNFFCIGVSAAFVLYFPEMFPNRMRATGAGLAYNVGRLLAIPMPLATAWAISRFGGSVSTGVLLSGSVYVIGLAALPFAPETRGEALPE